ncbi:MAG: hypothetical protein HC800_25235 [Phormidesmis sp. RL_2_1]|nr:hypothetical protein [Phormidesmis sp. RL_2_1]
MLNVIADEDGKMDYAVGLLIAGAVGSALILIGLIETRLRRELDEPTHPRLSSGLKFVGGIVAIAIGLVSRGLNIAALEALLLIPITAQMAYGLYVWFTQDIDDVLAPKL